MSASSHSGSARFASALPRRFRRASFVLGVLCACFSAGIGVTAPAAQANIARPAGGATAEIQGDGSTWAYNAVEQWIQDVTPNGLQVVYTGTGSAQGRIDYADDTVDFSVTDIGYQGKDPVTGASDTSNGRAYAYMPIVAGGTSFPYHLFENGKQVTNLRLSGETLAKIFTNQITNWDDPEIQADNDLKKPFPSLPIIPVVHSEGSGDSAQFSRWLATDFASIWDPFGGDTFTEYWPTAGPQKAENGSDSVINYITSSAADGSIGYDEYSYALGAGFPVVKVLNKAGYYTLPNQYNVAVALTKAQINYDTSSPNYLLENLDDVYVNPAPQTYPLSSYSYLLEPTSASDPKMTTAKRQALADYLYYSICSGQKEVGPIGYSPLPVNLVEAGFKQIAKLKQADSGVDLTNQDVSTCDNPTFVAGHPTQNYLAKIAPLPPACDKSGATECAAGVDDNATANPDGSKVTKTTGTTKTTTSTGSSGTTATTGTTTASTGGGGGSPGKSATSGTTGTTSAGGGSGTTGTTGTTGATGSSGATGTTGTTSATGTTGTTGTAGTSGTTAAADSASTPEAQVFGTTTDLPAGQGHGLAVTLAILAGVLLIGAIVVPPSLVQWLSNRGSS